MQIRGSYRYATEKISEQLNHVQVTALMKDHTKLLALGRTMPSVTKAQIQVYSPAGESLLLFSVCTIS